MPFPATPEPLTVALTIARRTAGNVKGQATDLRTRALAGPVERITVINYMGSLSSALVQFARIRTVSGIAAYARDQFDDQALDIVAEFTAMESAATDVRDWIFNNFPKNGGGAWMVNTYDNQGSGTDLMLTVGQLTPLVTELDALIATID